MQCQALNLKNFGEKIMLLEKLCKFYSDNYVSYREMADDMDPPMHGTYIGKLVTNKANISRPFQIKFKRRYGFTIEESESKNITPKSVKEHTPTTLPTKEGIGSM